MFAVPLLGQSGLNTKCAHATALFVMLPVCAIGAVIYAKNGYFSPQSIASACVGVFIGAIIGAAILDKINADILGLVFAALMLAAGIRSVIA